MRSDNLNKKIIEAAANHHPAYDDNAWQNMEKLLDKHLPQEKKRRRGFIILLFFFLLVGGSGIWYLSGIKKNNKRSNIPNASTIDAKEVSLSTNDTESKRSDQSNLTNDNNILSGISSSNNNIISSDKHESGYQPKMNTIPIQKRYVVSDNNFNSQKNNISAMSEREKVISKIDKQAKNKTNTDENLLSEKEKQVSKVDFEYQKKEVSINTLIDNSDSSVIAKTATDKTEVITLSEDKEPVNTKKQGDKAKKKGFFFISLTAGPDLSFVGSGNSGSVKAIGGIGVGYKTKNGLSFSTGFYSGRKVYTASPDKYNPPQIFTQYYPILENIAADCKVYEIPLTVSYKISGTEKNAWFASAGISSLIMKKENYVFDYKYSATGPSYKGNWSVDNENKHFFSVLTLSGGYQKQLNKTFSLSAEPYIKFPLQGVGYGRVKLNSAGVMFNLTIKPFVANPKK